MCKFRTAVVCILSINTMTTNGEIKVKKEIDLKAEPPELEHQDVKSICKTENYKEEAIVFSEPLTQYTTEHLTTTKWSEQYVESECDNKIFIKGELENHCEILPGKKPYQCNKAYTQNHNLKIHMKTHTEDKPYQCSHCNKYFARKQYLQKHVRTHTGEKPYKCSQCDKSFTRDHHLKRHLMTHTGEKPYQCSHCDKAFFENDRLKKHLKKHTDDKPYSCRQCDTSFSQKGKLITYLKKHTGEELYICDQCHHDFSTRFNPKQHLLTHDEEM